MTNLQESSRSSSAGTILPLPPYTPSRVPLTLRYLLTSNPNTLLDFGYNEPPLTVRRVLDIINRTLQQLRAVNPELDDVDEKAMQSFVESTFGNGMRLFGSGELMVVKQVGILDTTWEDGVGGYFQPRAGSGASSRSPVNSNVVPRSIRDFHANSSDTEDHSESDVDPDTFSVPSCPPSPTETELTSVYTTSEYTQCDCCDPQNDPEDIDNGSYKRLNPSLSKPMWSERPKSSSPPPSPPPIIPISHTLKERSISRYNRPINQYEPLVHDVSQSFLIGGRSTGRTIYSVLHEHGHEHEGREPRSSGISSHWRRVLS